VVTSPLRDVVGTSVSSSTSSPVPCRNVDGNETGRPVRSPEPEPELATIWLPTSFLDDPSDAAMSAVDEFAGSGGAWAR